MQPKPKNWGDILKLHSEIERQREELEIQLEKQKRAKFREELDALVEEKKLQKLNEKRNNYELLQARKDYEEYKQQVFMNPHALKGVYTDNRAADPRSSPGKESWGKSPDKTKESEKKNHEPFANVFQNHITDKPRFSEESARKSQPSKNSFYSGKSYGFETLKRSEDEIYELEKARFEKMKRDEEVFALKQLQNERMRQEIANTLQHQIRNKNENEQQRRHQELHADSQSLFHSIRDQDEAYQIRERLQEKQKIQNLEALNKQLEELRFRKHKDDDMLTPLEETLNRNDLEFVEKKVQPNVFELATSLVPGRNLTYDKKLQNQYIAKSFRYGNPALDRMDPSKPTLFDPRSNHPSRYQGGEGTVTPNIQPDQKQLYNQNRPQASRSVEPQYQRNLMSIAEKSRMSVQPKPVSRRSQFRGPSMHLPSEEYGTPEKLSSPMPTDSPEINSRKKSFQQSGGHFGMSSSVQDLRSELRKEFSYIAGKHGTHSNRMNIITGELKPIANVNKSPFAIY